jgi:2-methylcitrate dehydratase PrpD
MNGFTQKLAAQAACTQFADIPHDAILVAQQCFLDFLGVTLAGYDNPIVERIFDQCVEDGGHLQASVIGRPTLLSSVQAALVNGTASHVLDFDDVNMAWPGHPSVVLWPSCLAIGQRVNASGAEILTAFVAGYEATSKLGEALRPGHYSAGFHPTATLGNIGAAVSAGHLLQLDETQMAHSIAIAATQAAGLKSMFGTMCKPLHAGKAASIGVQSAQLAKRGFEGRTDFIECVQGFAATHSANFDVNDEALSRPVGHHTRATLFKYHATCYLTHPIIEACHAVTQQNDFDPASTEVIHIETHQMAASVCHIEKPTTGLEAKFSMTLCAALGLLGYDTGRLDLYTDDMTQNAVLISLRDKVQIVFVDDISPNLAKVRIHAKDGRVFEAQADCGIPAENLDRQTQRLMAKFDGLAGQFRHVKELASSLSTLTSTDIQALMKGLQS